MKKIYYLTIGDSIEIFEDLDIAKNYKEKLQKIQRIESFPKECNYVIYEKDVINDDLIKDGEHGWLIICDFNHKGDLLLPTITFSSIYPNNYNYEIESAFNAYTAESEVLKFYIQYKENDTLKDIHAKIIKFIQRIYHEIQPKLKLREYTGPKVEKAVFYQFSK